MENEKLEEVVREVEAFKSDSTQQLREHITSELSAFRKTLPGEALTEDLDNKVETEVNRKIQEFSQEIDLKPKALYYSLKSELELNDEISEQELTLSAYDFLEKQTKNKFLKKILKELKKENKG